MVAEEGERHIFYSRGAARAYSALNGTEAQGVIDLIKEISLSVNVNIVSDEENTVALLRSSASVDEVPTIKTLQQFLRIIGETSKIHKLMAGDSSEKKIERYSNIAVSYYKLISEMGRNEAEDFSEFINLFSLKHNLSDNYVSHIPPFMKPYRSLFRRNVNARGKRPKIAKKRFPDYFTEIRWIARDVKSKEGVTAIAVPDDYLAVAVAKELELYGIAPTVASSVSEIVFSDAPYNFIISALRCLEEDFTFESMISLLENPFSGVDPSSIYDIKDICYQKNVTRGLRDWRTLFLELEIDPSLLDDLEFLGEIIDRSDGLESLSRFCDKYLGENNYPGRIVSVLGANPDRQPSDAGSLINDLESMKYTPKVEIIGDPRILVGKPLDLAGLPLENLYVCGMDAASSLRQFPEELRDFLEKIGLEGAFENLMEEAYTSLIGLSENVTVSYSSLDDKLSYTESTALYDSIEGEEEYVARDTVFIPADPIAEWESGRPTKNSEKYRLDGDLIKMRMEKPIYPTFIENYAGCHFKGFVNGLLGVDEINAPREFLDPRTTGSMTHKILEKYYSTDLSPADFGRMADSFVRSEISREKYQSRIEALKFYREKYLLNGRLARFFVMDVRHALELGRRTIQKEFHFPTADQQVFYEFDGKKIKIGGFVDRIDEERGELCIIDYKSSLYGYPKNDLCDERHAKVQLYFYKLGVESVLRKKVRAAAYVSFRDIGEGFNTAGFFNAIPNEEAQVRKCRDIIDPVLGDFLEGDFDPVVKEGGSLWKCENELFCPLLSVCRVQERRW